MADFGLARTYLADDKERPYTNKVAAVFVFVAAVFVFVAAVVFVAFVVFVVYFRRQRTILRCAKAGCRTHTNSS